MAEQQNSYEVVFTAHGGLIAIHVSVHARDASHAPMQARLILQEALAPFGLGMFYGPGDRPTWAISSVEQLD